MQEQIPEILKQAIGNESTDFIIQTKRGTSVKGAVTLLIIGGFWTLINLIIDYSYLVQITSNKNMGLRFSDALVSNQLVSQGSSLFDKIISGFAVSFFLLVGLIILGLGINSLLAKGSWFVGTPSRLISCKRNKIRSIDWREIKGGIDVKGDNNKGDVLIGLSSAFKDQWPVLSGNNFFYMLGIKDAFKIADVCRKRIKENNK